MYFTRDIHANNYKNLHQTYILQLRPNDKESKFPALICTAVLGFHMYDRASHKVMGYFIIVNVYLVELLLMYNTKLFIKMKHSSD